MGAFEDCCPYEPPEAFQTACYGMGLQTYCICCMGAVGSFSPRAPQLCPNPLPCACACRFDCYEGYMGAVMRFAIEGHKFGPSWRVCLAGRHLPHPLQGKPYFRE